MNEKNYRVPDAASQAYRLLELIALCGELPTSALLMFPCGIKYRKTILTELTQSKLIRAHRKDALCAYRPTVQAKRLLLAHKPERFSFYLTGTSETNQLKSEPERRLRLHRIAEILLLMQNVGVSVFRDEKPLLFSPGIQPPIALSHPAFYTSREVKELGLETVKIRSSRMVGTLLTPDGIYLCYNNGQHVPTWDFRSEIRCKSLLELFLCRQKLPAQYAACSPCGILFGAQMSLLSSLLMSADGKDHSFLLFDGDFPHFYFLTTDAYGETLLQLLCDSPLRQRLDRTLLQGLFPPQPGFPCEHDALTHDGMPVLFCYLPDLPRLLRFRTALTLQNRRGQIICFDFQQETLQKCCGEQVQLQTISFEKYERRFSPSTSTRK